MREDSNGVITAQWLIDNLKLKPLPREGGYYRETYKNRGEIPGDALPARYGGARSFSTAIYYLLTPDTCSAIHRVRSDEIFHFYLGDPVTMLLLYMDSSSEVVTLGNRPHLGQHPQYMVPRGVWQGCILSPGGRFALMGTTVAPGFEFDDYEHGCREELLRTYPHQEDLVNRLLKQQESQ